MLVNITTAGDQLYALVFFPKIQLNGGKCRVYQYNLSTDGGGGEASLVKKIKVGSGPSTTMHLTMSGRCLELPFPTQSQWLSGWGNTSAYWIRRAVKSCARWTFPSRLHHLVHLLLVAMRRLRLRSARHHFRWKVHCEPHQRQSDGGVIVHQ